MIAEDPGGGWRPRPLAAFLVRLAWVLLPALVGGLVGLALAAVLRSAGWPGWARLLVALAGAALAVVGTERLSRRLLPLATLLSLSAVFSDPVPSRFRAALGGGVRRGMRQRLAEAGGQRPLADAHVATALALLTRLSAHDRGSRGHSERVRAFVDLIATEMGVRGAEFERLRWVALLHDVGKVSVPVDVLNKPGRLEEAEWHDVRRHPEEGGRLAEPLRPVLGAAIDGISQHHERWDGGGYPAGLAGEAIAASARIVAVADAVEVMTGARRYQPRVGIQRAREELLACSGTQFDPEVVRAFMALPLSRLRRIVIPMAWILPTTSLGLDGLTGAEGGVAGLPDSARASDLPQTTDLAQATDAHQLAEGAALPPDAALPDLASAHPLMADHHPADGGGADGAEELAAALENR